MAKTWGAARYRSLYPTLLNLSPRGLITELLSESLFLRRKDFDLLSALLRPDLYKMHQRFRRFLQTFSRIEFELPVKIMTAGE